MNNISRGLMMGVLEGNSPNNLQLKLKCKFNLLFEGRLMNILIINRSWDN